MSEELVVPQLRAVDAVGVLRELGRHLAADCPGVSGEQVARALQAREELGSTALEAGIAIPHARLAAADRALACLGRSRAGVEFGATDGRPTHIFFALVAPADAAAEHLTILARASSLLRRAELRERLMAAGTAEEMRRILVAEDGERWG